MKIIYCGLKCMHYMNSLTNECECEFHYLTNNIKIYKYLIYYKKEYIL